MHRHVFPNLPGLRFSITTRACVPFQLNLGSFVCHCTRPVTLHSNSAPDPYYTGTLVYNRRPRALVGWLTLGVPAAGVQGVTIVRLRVDSFRHAPSVTSSPSPVAGSNTALTLFVDGVAANSVIMTLTT